MTRSMRSKLNAMRPALPCAFSCSSALTMADRREEPHALAMPGEVLSH
jgi:hypothetical protein